MSSNEQFPSAQGSNSTSEQIPHSGVHGYEAPVDTSHAESLQDAHDQGLLTVPENPGALTSEKKKRSMLTRAGLVLGGLAAVAGLGAGAKSVMSGGESTPAPERSPSTSGPVTAGENEGPSPENETTTDIYTISAASNPTFESAVTMYYDRLNTYYASSSDTYDQPGDPQYLDALFGADWASNGELAAYVGSLEKSSQNISTNHFSTGENGDTEYEHNVEVTGVSDVEESADRVAGNVTLHATDNIMDTALSAFSSTGENLDEIAEFHFTFENVDGNWQVVEVDNLATAE